jgi:hypothetical protein
MQFKVMGFQGCSQRVLVLVVHCCSIKWLEGPFAFRAV